MYQDVSQYEADLDRVPDQAFSITIDSIQEQILEITTDEVDKALSATEAEELNRTRYRNILKRALNETDKLIELIHTNRSITVKMHFEEELGTIEDYVNGIKFARDIISKNKLTDFRVGGKFASIYWLKLYDDDDVVYSYTIAFRLEGFKAKAPWWTILNDGTPTSLPTDREGGFNPLYTIPASRFVDRIQRRVSDLATSTYNRELKANEDFYISQRNYWQDKASELTNLLVEITRRVVRLRGNIKEADNLYRAVDFSRRFDRKFFNSFTERAW